MNGCRSAPADRASAALTDPRRSENLRVFVLAKDGRPEVTIHIPAWAEAHETFAAGELARYVNKITNAELPVRRGLRRVGRTAVVLADLSHPAAGKLLPKGIGEDLKYDGYRIRTVQGRLYIVSNEPGGLVFGVYEYLRRFCGCAFPDYASHGETIPRAGTLRHGEVDLLDNPACWYRAMQIGVTGEPEEVLSRRLDWMAKNGYSHVLVYYGNSNLSLVDGIFSKQGDTDWARYRDWFIPALQKRGIKIAFGHHNFGMLMPKEQYLAERPDFYALIDGKRVQAGQLDWCLSNDGLIETVAKRIIDLAGNNPEADIMSLWPNDGIAPVCQCRECQKLIQPGDEIIPGPGGDYRTRWGRRGTPAKARLYMHMYNRVAERLAAVYPKMRLSVISYGDLNDPPLTDVKIHPNIMVHLALYWRCSKHALADPKCDLNRQFVSMIESWLQVLPDPSSLVLTTYEQGMGCWKSLPFPVTELLFKDWAWAKAKGIGGFKTNASTSNHGVYNINYAAQTRMMREDPPSYDEWLADFCVGFYGEAAKPMEKLYRLWESRMRNARAPHVDPSPHEFIHKVFSKRALQECIGLCDKALGMTDDAQARWRIERMRALIQYTEINRAAPNDALVKLHHTGAVTDKERRRIRAYIERELDFTRPLIETDADLFGMRPYAERYLRSKRWLQRVEGQDGKIEAD